MSSVVSEYCGSVERVVFLNLAGNDSAIDAILEKKVSFVGVEPGLTIGANGNGAGALILEGAGPNAISSSNLIKLSSPDAVGLGELVLDHCSLLFTAATLRN